MRDPERLDNFYDKLKQLHKTYVPDWRFMQFVINFQNWLKIHYQIDGFYLEENRMIEKVEEYVKWLMNW